MRESPAPMRQTSTLELWLNDQPQLPLTDLGGGVWQMSMESGILPSASEPLKPDHWVNLLFSCEQDTAQLIATGVLNRNRDQRLMGMLGDRLFYFSLPAVTLKSPKPELLRHQVAMKVRQIRELLRKDGIITFKQKKLYQLVEQAQDFGARRSAALLSRQKDEANSPPES